MMNGSAGLIRNGCSRMIDISNPSLIPPDDPDHPFIPSKTVYEQHRQPIYACAFNPYQPDGCVPVLATAAKNMITIYECPLDSNKIVLVRSIKDPSPDMDIFTLTWCYDITDKAHRIAFGGYSGLIRLVDPSSGNLLMNMYGHGDHVNEMRTDPNNSMIFASVSKDTTIRLWNIRVHGPIAILGGYEGHKDQILSLDWSLDSKYIVSCSMDHSIRLWHLGTDKLQERIPINTDLHNDYVDCVRFLGHYVVSKGSDMSMVVFRFGSFGEEFYKIRPKLQVDTSALQLVRMDLPDSDIWFIKFDIDPLNRIPSYCNTAGILNGPTAKKAKRRGRRLGKKRNDSDSGSSEDSDMRTN
ncbi:WD domain, G-beta repeat protein [Ostertagia ostertagi]